jgi:enoyl-CoA hydratase
MSPDDISRPSLSIQGALATVRLCRPTKINVIGPEDIVAITQSLETAVADPAVSTILICGRGERGFCAGGDIKRVRQMIVSGRFDDLAAFWSVEYQLDHLIATCPKPVVSIAHGLTLGGGMGLASHASHRVVTDSTRMGMPEVLIGLSPDVGGLYLFSRAPGRSGAFAALTAAHLSAGDALHMGLADVYVPTGQLEMLIERLTSCPATEAFDGFDERPASWIAEHQSHIDNVFGAESVAEVLDIARDEGPGRGAVAEATITALTTASPTALCVAYEALRRAERMTELSQCLDQDLRVGQHCSRHPDLAEGIRARVVEKDRAPRWQPPTLAEVSAAQVDQFFEPTGSPFQIRGW